MSLAAPEAETGSARGFPAVSRAQPADQRFHQGDIFPLPQPANDGLDFSHLPANYLFSLNPTIHSLGHFLRSVDLNSIKKEKKKKIKRKAFTSVSHQNGWTRSADKNRPCEGGHYSWEAPGRLPASLLTMQTPAECPRTGGGGDQKPDCGQSHQGCIRGSVAPRCRAVWRRPVVRVRGIDPLVMEMRKPVFICDALAQLVNTRNGERCSKNTI